jgi:hypothetical protein
MEDQFSQLGVQTFGALKLTSASGLRPHRIQINTMALPEKSADLRQIRVSLL